MRETADEVATHLDAIVCDVQRPQLDEVPERELVQLADVVSVQVQSTKVPQSGQSVRIQLRQLVAPHDNQQIRVNGKKKGGNRWAAENSDVNKDWGHKDKCKDMDKKFTYRVQGLTQ